MKGHHPKGSTPAEALALLFDSWKPEPQVEIVPVQEAVERVLAEDQFSDLNIPTSRAARMDGIALHSSDFENGIPDTTDWKLNVEYAHADMGDDFDDSFDAVIPVEAVDLSKGYPVFMFEKMPQPGSGINPKGGTLKEGRLLASAGKLLHLNDVAALIMGGKAQVPVIAKPKVAFIPTGSELVAVGETPGRGQVVDSNSTMARYMLAEYGAEPIIYPIVRDEPETLAHNLDDALEKADVVIFNGGTSKGSEDFNRPLLENKGTLLSHWMNAGPGRPLCAGVAEGKAVIVVPGPPAGAMNVMEYFVSSVIDHWYGIETHRQVLRGTLTEDVECPEHMMFLVNAMIERSEDGQLLVTPRPFKNDSISAITATGYFHHPIGVSLIAEGSEVDISVFGTRSQGLL